MTRQLRSFLAAMVCCLLAVPAFAGTVYVPVTDDVEIDGVRYETQIWFSNLGGQDRRFASYFIDTGSNGTDRPGEITYGQTLVRSQRTVLVQDATDEGTVGMLEIFGAPQLIVQAQLVSSVDGVKQAGVNLPVIDDKTLYPIGSEVYLQGLSRGGDHFTDLIIVNLGPEASECVVDMYRASGDALVSSAVLAFSPLSHNQFDDVLGIVGEQSVTGVRTTVSCDQPFYAFAVTYNPGQGAATVLLPSASLDSALVRPGDNSPPPPPPPTECPTGGTCFSFPGVVHAPSPGNEVRRLLFPFAPGLSYRQLHLQMEVFHGGWDNRSPDGIHNFFWLARNKYRSNTFGYVNARGPGKAIVTSLTNVNLAPGDTQRLVQNILLTPGATYRVDYLYDTIGGIIDLKIFNKATGALVVSLTDSTRVKKITTEGDGFLMDLGLKRFSSDVPSYGWSYNNLQLDFCPDACPQ